jgi:hypothetical protein
MIASPMALPAAQLSVLYSLRRPKQALFLWSERRYHPAYRFLRGLIETDATTWRPRFVHQRTLSSEPASPGLMRWQAMESLALVMELTNGTPMNVNAVAAENAQRNTSDFISIVMTLDEVQAFLEIGLREPIARRETVYGGSGRKAGIDELDESVPIRLIDDQPSSSSPLRWLACAAPAEQELARAQCLAFLEAFERRSVAEEEATLWTRALAAWNAVEASISEGGAVHDVEEAQRGGFRLILGRSPAFTSPASA